MTKRARRAVELENELIEKLLSLKYESRADLRDRAAIERNFREKFQRSTRSA